MREAYLCECSRIVNPWNHFRRQRHMQLLQMCLYTDARVCSRFNVRRSVLINYINFAVDLNFDLLPLLKHKLNFIPIKSSSRVG